jgi:hypothetical protein
MPDSEQNLTIKKTLKPQDMILRFVDSLGHARDAEIYLRLFSDKDSFAIIALDEDVLRDEFEAVVYNLRYLMRLGLYPVVLLLAEREAIAHLGIEEALSKARLNLHFPAADLPELDRYAYIQESLKKKLSPVLMLAPDSKLTGEMTKLAYELRTQKIIFLKRSGGLFDLIDKTIINLVNLHSERDALLQSTHLSDDDKSLLRQCDEIITSSQHRVFISIVNPINLIRELFTVKGAGTLIEKGSQILSFTNWQNIDRERLKQLLEVSFGKPIRDDFFKTKISHIYIEENYQGAALVSDFGDLSYLSKFAVGIEARGLGVGRDLWDVLLKNHPHLFWRSDPNKHLVSWYAKQCDGMHRTARWTVFWKGIEASKINKAIELALKQPIDFAQSE